MLKLSLAAALALSLAPVGLSFELFCIDKHRYCTAHYNRFDRTGENLARTKRIIAEQGLPVDEFHVWESLLECHKNPNGTLRLEYVMTCEQWGGCARSKRAGSYCPLPKGVPMPPSRGPRPPAEEDDDPEDDPRT